MKMYTGYELVKLAEKAEKTKFFPHNNNKMPLKVGKWKVSKKGDMTYDNGRYYIERDKLKEDDWIIHLMQKGWIDYNEFIPAYFQALKNIGEQFINVKIHY